MKYTVYRTTCKTNGKFYIGKHQTEDLDDGYLGSGKILWRAIDKYGKENFTKEILHIFESEEEMNAKEAELVDPNDPLSMNLCPGGQGGFGYLNSHPKVKEWKAKGGSRKVPKETKKHLREIMLSRRDELSRKVKESIASGKFVPLNWTGRKHTEETKIKMSLSSRGKSAGEKNSQYGTMWITNGSENKKISKSNSIPEGWVRGRKMKRV